VIDIGLLIFSDLDGNDASSGIVVVFKDGFPVR
jgi:hypothetical protein